MDWLKTTDYYWVNDLVAGNQYLVEGWERSMAKATMIAALHWSCKQELLWAERRRRQKHRGLVIETKPLGL